jgi:hypothetical protein
VLNLRISSRAFSRGFDIDTPVECLSARRVPLSSTGEILISNPSENQIARLERESFLSSIYNIIISGGSIGSAAMTSLGELGSAREKRGCSSHQNTVTVGSSFQTELMRLLIARKTGL